MKKKIGVLCLAAVFVFALAGCGGGTQSESETLKLAKECTVETGLHVDCSDFYGVRQDVYIQGDNIYVSTLSPGAAEAAVYLKNSEGSFNVAPTQKYAQSSAEITADIQQWKDQFIKSLGLNLITDKTKFEMGKETVAGTEYDCEMFKDGETEYKYCYDGDKKLCYILRTGAMETTIYALDNKVDEEKFVIPADYKVESF